EVDIGLRLEVGIQLHRGKTRKEPPTGLYSGKDICLLRDPVKDKLRAAQRRVVLSSNDLDVRLGIVRAQVDSGGAAIGPETAVEYQDRNAEVALLKTAIAARKRYLKRVLVLL